MFRSYKDTYRTPVRTGKETSKKYFCDLCEDEKARNQPWDFELDFEIHRRRVHKVELMKLMKEPKNHMCTVCMRAQPDRPTLLAHIKKHHLYSPDSSFVKREIFICDYCNNLFFNKQLLIAHVKYYHVTYNRSEKITCPSCNRSIMVRSMWFHFLYHGIHICTCPICLKTFDNGYDVLKHVETHLGYYMCNLCMFESKNDNLFQNHKEKHKKTVNLEGKSDVNAIARFFVPQKRPATWNRKYTNLFRGITMSSEIQICVLCRAMCETEEQMLQHIHGDHSVVNEVEIKRHICICGEEFFNNILLKHHIFMLKDGHKAYNGTKQPKQTSEPNLPQNSNMETPHGIEIQVLVDFKSKTEQEIEPPSTQTDKETDRQTDNMKRKNVSDTVASKKQRILNIMSSTEDEGRIDNEESYSICDEDTYATSKDYYERAISVQGGLEVKSEQSGTETEEIKNVSETNEGVFGVLEVPANTTEDTDKIIDRIIVDESIYEYIV